MASAAAQGGSLKAVNWLGRGYEAFSTGKDVYDGIQMIRQGNNWGWLSIAGCKYSGGGYLWPLEADSDDA